MPATLTSDDLPVEEWRLEQLRRAGWPEAEALLLALDAGVDLQQACDLLADGCKPELAWQILN